MADFADRVIQEFGSSETYSAVNDAAMRCSNIIKRYYALGFTCELAVRELRSILGRHIVG
jgi:hypothetical protein